MKNSKSILNISIISLFLALIIGFSYIPNLGYITIGPISFTTIHVIVLIGAMIFGKWKGLLFGTFFGILSLLIALQYPTTINYLFVNPFVSVLPRALFGFISGWIFDLFRKRSEVKDFLFIAGPLSAILTIMHTFLTLVCLYVFGYLDIFKISEAMGMMDIIEANQNAFGSFGNFLLTFIAPGAVCEAIGAAILTPSISTFYAYNKLPRNFYRFNIVQEIGTSEAKITRKMSIALMTFLSVLAIGLCVLVLCLFYLK